MSMNEKQMKTSAYSDGYYAYLPVDKVNVRALRFGLSYGDQPSEAVISDNYVRVPREFDAGIEVRDESPTFERDFDLHVLTKARSYQLAPFEALIENKKGILNLGCGYGKTVLATYFIVYCGVKAAVLVDKVNLISQWRDELLLHTTLTEDDIGVVQGKKWDYKDKKVVLCSIATLSTRIKKHTTPKDFYRDFGLVIFDECHHLAAPTFSRVVPKFCGMRIGLSATPHREDGLEQIFFNHIGPIIYSKVDQPLRPKILFVQTDVPSEFSQRREVLDKAGEVNHRRLCQALGADEGRDRLLKKYIRLLLDEGHHTLVLSHSVDHVENLHASLAKEGIPVGKASGKVKAEDRAKEIKAHPVSIGTLDVASEALNVPSLSALIVSTPFGARAHGNVLQQALGRIQRTVEGKKHPIAIFIEDRNVGLCHGLLMQVKKRLKEKGYIFEYRHTRTEPHL